ncbi:hypothetical protein HYH03_006944 [Edaphochlamys debaryana]|uniref:Ankyrin repeat domain-containing protein n=1 Tax=Edaphochlamys debaryana TaxID=47281 RepID=A0A836BZQ2_9CHLO|nr:hypothetical protein HYH03_006944 [Edaphochlamys debaryana]|eukprot:KAG2495011.1 hypothetical protein HYH03_006944 [Edaphochlamys debaryana]
MLSSSGASAAREGHVAALTVLARSPWGSDVDVVAVRVLEAAAQAGRVEVLAWAWEAFRSDWDAACARSPGLLTWAARSGSVEAIRWVHSHGGGGVGQEAAWSGAVESGCQAAVEVLAELGGPMPSDGSPFARALELREWALLPLLHAQGVPMGRWAQERPLLARALEAGAAPASLLQGLAGEG